MQQSGTFGQGTVAASKGLKVDIGARDRDAQALSRAISD